MGGDLQGVINQLDYIKGLGATTIWLTPVVKNEPYGYHGYWTEDFYSVDPHFGDMATLKELVTEAHNREIKVILDYVVNHTGYQHPWTKDSSKESWFHNNGDITNYNDINQVENFNLAGLPDLNTENPAVKAYFFENVLWWIRETGVDGLRLDTVRHVPMEYWNEFSYIIKQEFPDFYLLGEVWKNSASLLESYHELGIDGLTNYAMFNGIEKTFKLYGDANTLKVSINNETKFTNPEQNGIFIDNHDVQRLISRTNKHGEAYWKQGMTFIMTYPSIPIIYYGTEIGMDGEDDPDNRQFMKWDQVGNDYYTFYQKLVDFRTETRNYKTIDIPYVTKDIIVIRYQSEDDFYLTVFNISEMEKEITLDFSGEFEDVLTKEIYQIVKGENTLIKGLSSLILKELK
jgi:alpha-amylase